MTQVRKNETTNEIYIREIKMGVQNEKLIKMFAIKKFYRVHKDTIRFKISVEISSTCDLY